MPSEKKFESCVVTGGAGAIGSRLVRRLLAAGAKSVHVVDDLSSGYLWLLSRRCQGPSSSARHRRVFLVSRSTCRTRTSFIWQPSSQIKIA